MFPAEVCDAIGNYVYRLIDPRDGATFYVGRGVRNRVFQHVAAVGDPRELDGAVEEPEDERQDEIDLKFDTIREIQNAGLAVVHVIHRHGLSEDQAKEVEAALIDAYAGLTNKVGGSGADRGPMHVSEIIQAYAAPIAEFSGISAILINIGRNWTAQCSIQQTYDITRYAWRVQADRVARAQYVMCHAGGLIRGVYVVDKNGWLVANAQNFPGFPAVPPTPVRRGFVGRPADNDVRDRFVRTRIPDQYRPRGAQNPIRYVNLG